MSDEMRTELKAFKNEVREELGGFREEMGGLRKEWGEFREEMAGFRSEMRAVVGDLADSVRKLAIGYASLDGRVTGIEIYMKEKLVTRDEFHSRMDAFSGRLTDAQLHWAHQKERTDDHDRRLTKLEERPH